MPAIALDYINIALQFLSGVNVATFLGATNATWSGNSTITAVCNAIMALAPVAGGSDDLKLKVCESLKNGVSAGIINETHGFATIAAAQQAITTLTNMPEVPATYTGNLAQ